MTIPSCQYAESALLGACIINPEATRYAITNLDTDDFLIDKFKAIFDAIAIAFAEDSLHMLDIVKVNNSLDNTRCSYAELGEVVETTPDAAAYKEYAEIVRDARVQRNLLSLSLQLSSLVREGTGSGSASIPQAEKLVEGLGHALTNRLHGSVDLHAQTLATIRKNREQGVDLLWGIAPVDNVFGALWKGKTYVVGGKTGHGKTTFALNVAAKVRSQGKRVLYNGFEDLDQIYIRLAAMETGIPIESFTRSQELDDGEYSKVVDAVEAVHSDSLRILPGVHAYEMEQIVQEYKPDLIIVDYIQRYAYKFEPGKGESLRTHQIGKAMSDIQDVAISNNVACLVLSQFKRRTDENSLRKPCLADLKESGDIENMADGVLPLWWQKKDQPDNHRIVEEKYTVIIAKHKLGPVGEIDLKIEPTTLQIKEWNK